MFFEVFVLHKDCMNKYVQFLQPIKTEVPDLLKFVLQQINSRLLLGSTCNGLDRVQEEQPGNILEGYVFS